MVGIVYKVVDIFCGYVEYYCFRFWRIMWFYWKRIVIGFVWGFWVFMWGNFVFFRVNLNVMFFVYCLVMVYYYCLKFVDVVNGDLKSVDFG